MLSEDEIRYFEETAVQRDNANNGMTRKEMISFIQLFIGRDYKKAENHFDYLIPSKKLSRLKGDGKAMKAQNTNTARSQIRVASQLRWHCMIDAIWSAVKQYNQLPADDVRRPFEDVMEYFWLNLDKTCIRCEDGELRVLGAKDRKVTSVRNSDSKFSITILRVGSTAGVDGPIIFLVEGKSIKSNCLKDLPRFFNYPHGSCVIPTPTAYMTDEAWEKNIPRLIKGISEIKWIKNCLEFKVMLTFDG